MADNTRKTPFAFNSQRQINGRIDRRLASLGQALPAHVIQNFNSIVQIAFDVTDPVFRNLPNVYVPLYGCEYIRYPIQPGCKGVVFAADVRIGITTGLGPHVYDFTQPGNLTSLYFMPMANTQWLTVPDANQVTIYGPDGCLIQTTSGSASINVKGGTITMSAGGHTVAISSAGVVIDGIPFGTHYHTGVTTGSGNTGGPL